MCLVFTSPIRMGGGGRGAVLQYTCLVFTVPRGGGGGGGGCTAVYVPGIHCTYPDGTYDGVFTRGGGGGPGIHFTYPDGNIVHERHYCDDFAAK